MTEEIEDEVWMDDESYYLLKCSKLEKKLDIAVKALKRIREISECNPNQLSYIGRFADRKVKTALTEIDKVVTSAKEEE